MGVTTEPEIQAAPADSNSNSPIRIKVENGKLDRDESKSTSMIDLRFYDKGNREGSCSVDIIPVEDTANTIQEQSAIVEDRCCFLFFSPISSDTTVRRSSAEITFNLHSLRWRKSQIYTRLGLFSLIFLFCVPYNSYALYCYMTPKVVIQQASESVSMAHTRQTTSDDTQNSEAKELGLFALTSNSSETNTTSWHDSKIDRKTLLDMINAKK